MLLVMGWSQSPVRVVEANLNGHHAHKEVCYCSLKGGEFVAMRVASPDIQWVH